MLHGISTHLRRWLLVLAIGGPFPAEAAVEGGYAAEYTGYSHGFVVLKLTGTLMLTKSRYDAHVVFHTAGLAGLAVHADTDSRVSGSLQGRQALPSLFEVSGRLRGVERLTRISYRDGNPVVLALSPPVEQERSVVPPQQSAHTIDTLSAMALLIRQLGQTGQCDGTVETFDGRRLASQAVHTVGRDLLEPTGRSSFAGPAVRCDFEGRQLGGFIHGENEADLRRPRHGSAWLAEVVPGAPPVPVRVAFENRFLGEVTLYLTRVTAAR